MEASNTTSPTAGALPLSVQIEIDALDAELNDAYERLNREHFVSTEGGRTYVFRESMDTELKVPRLEKMNLTAFTQLHAADRVNKMCGIDKNGDIQTTQVPVASSWFNSTSRRQYVNGLALHPNADSVPCGVYNLWQGWGCAPAVDISVFAVKWALRHIRDVICSGDKTNFRYLINWLAWGVQNPGLPAEVAVVLIGGRGTGKGTFVNWMRDIYGSHARHIFNSQHLTGKFNAHLRSALFVFLDEAFFAGDKAGEPVLKGIITENQLLIEPKGVDSFMVPNRLKIMMATNSLHAIPAGVDERRFFVLEVSNCHQQDKRYFGQLDRWWKSGGKEAFLGFLLNHDISGFDIRTVPNTKALENQKTESLDPTDKWLLGVLADGQWPPGSKWENEMGRSTVVRSLEYYVKEHSLRYVNTSAESVGKRLRKHMFVSSGQKTTGGREKTWIFPDLDDARKQFADSLGLKHFDWDAI